MNNARRQRTERQKRGSMVLTERDRAIVRAVYRFRFLTSGQIAERFFTSKSKADRRLRVLYDHGYLDRIERPAASGRSELIYALWTRGANLVSQEDGLSMGDLHWKRSMNAVKPDRMQHELDIVRFHLAMDGSVEATQGIEWLFWRERREIVTRKNWQLVTIGQAGSGTMKLIPDTFFALLTPKGKTAFFLEVDRGTERASVFRNKLLAYQSAFESGAVQKVTGFKTFRVLTVVLDTKRLQSLLQLASKTKHHLLYWFMLDNDLYGKNLLTEAAWYVPNKNEPISLYRA